VNIIYRRELAAVAEAAEQQAGVRGNNGNGKDPAPAAETVVAERRAELTQQYRGELANPFVAASRGYLDDVIHPSESRSRLVSALALLRDKRQTTPKRKHGNIPL
jgi:acetyl-CoA carboxylase carboxyltransferase component